MFGSAAKNQIGSISDSNFLVRFSDPPGLLEYADNYLRLLDILKRAAESELEIIGEAVVNQLLKIQPSLQISVAKNIFSLRNFIIDAYDAIDDELIWAILQKDVPILKDEIQKVKG